MAQSVEHLRHFHSRYCSTNPQSIPTSHGERPYLHAMHIPFSTSV